MKISKKISISILIVIITGVILILLQNNRIINNNELKTENQEPLISDSGDIVKTGVDLTTADYHQFYDDLSPYGEWIKVKPEDLGIKPGKSTGSKNNDNSSLINNIFGIQDAYADSYVGWDFFFVWQPSPSISVGVVAGEPSPAYVPYVNGRWIYTERGWYFKAPTHYEEIVHHYGRWCYNGVYGWIWIPGHVWAPSWVRWAEDDDNIGWAPIETSFYIYEQYYIVPQPVITYVSVEKKYFLEPEPYKYFRINKLGNDNQVFKNFEINSGPKFKNNVLVNSGPDIRKIEKVYGKNIMPVNIKNLGDASSTKFGKGKNDVSNPVVKSNTDKKSITYGRSNMNSGKEKSIMSKNNKLKNDFKNNRDKSIKNSGKTESKEKTYGLKKYTGPDKNVKQKPENRKEDRVNQKNNNNEKFKQPDSFQNKKEGNNNKDSGRRKK